MSRRMRPTETCRVEARQRAQSAAAALDELAVVVAVDILSPTDDLSDHWTLDILLDTHACGVPPEVLAELACRGISLLDVELQGEFWQAIATA